MRFCYAYLILHRFVRGTISPNPTAPPSRRLLGDIEFVVTEFFATGSQVPLLLVIADI
jgi:hypothetical protein